MPRVKPLVSNKKIMDEWEQLSIKIMHECIDLKITKTALAKEIGITQQAVSYQFAEKRLQVPTMLAFEKLKKSREREK